MNVTGQVLGTFTVKGELTQLNLPVYAAGVYFVKVTGDDKVYKLVIE